nr:reverse transcriptase domain-containing protein [Tanacetum cinerariifolium]
MKNKLGKKRGQAPKCAKAIQAEVQKLVEAGIMREVYYHNRLSNPVMRGDLDACLLYKPRIAGPGTKLYSYGKASSVTSLHSQETSEFAASNNEAEYEALIDGLQIAAQMGVQNIHVLVEIPKEKSIKEKEVTTVVEEDGPTWMTPIMEYLKEWTLPSDRKEARKFRIKARQYELLEGVLYMRSFLTPWLRCVRPLQVEYVIREIHKGSCSMHAEPPSVVAKAIRLQYY